MNPTIQIYTYWPYILINIIPKELLKQKYNIKHLNENILHSIY